MKTQIDEHLAESFLKLEEKCRKHENTLDLMRDEFKRIRALAYHEEISEICDRAVSVIESRATVVQQIIETTSKLRRADSLRAADAFLTVAKTINP